MKPGDRVRLRGRSQHGKNRIRESGEDVWVIEIRDQIQTTKHQNLTGPFVMVTTSEGSSRWISIADDPDFEIIN